MKVCTGRVEGKQLRILVPNDCEAELVRAARQARNDEEIVLQMADVTQIDSGDVGALGTTFIAAHNREAEIKLAALHSRVAEVLRITGLDLLFDIRDSESEALAPFHSKPRCRVNEPNGDLSPNGTALDHAQLQT